MNLPPIPPGVVVALAAILAALLLFVVVRTRARTTEEAETPSGDVAEAETDLASPGMEQPVLDFALDLRRTDSKERVHQTIAQKLPALLGVTRIWIVARFGDRRQVIAPGQDGTTNANPLTTSEGDWATFPLRVGGQPVGVLGIETGGTPLPSRSRRAVSMIAPLIAESLHALDTIAQLRELSSVDQLTGCSTRQAGLQRLHAELTRAHRASRQVALLLLDLDYFKSINDRFGHGCGDAVLNAVGRTLTHTLRVSDIRCRWGGEEFLVVLPEIGLEQAQRVAVTLTRRIAELATYCGQARVQVTTSIGVTVSSREDEDADVLIARADAALYRAKADGRNCVRVLPSDAKSAPAAPAQPTALSARDRRNPQQPDRRRYPGLGRRKSDLNRGPRAAFGAQ